MIGTVGALSCSILMVSRPSRPGMMMSTIARSKAEPLACGRGSLACDRRHVDLQHHFGKSELTDAEQRLRRHRRAREGFTGALRPIETVTHVDDIYRHLDR